MMYACDKFFSVLPWTIRKTTNLEYGRRSCGQSERRQVRRERIFRQVLVVFEVDNDESCMCADENDVKQYTQKE